MSAVSLPFAKEQRVMLAEWFKRFPNGSQADLDAFRVENPDFEYLAASTLKTKRRQLLTLGILSPVDDEDRAAIERGRKGKPHFKPYHPAQQKFEQKRRIRMKMRSHVHY